MRIGELARRSGVTTPTLRFYEEIGLLRPSERTASGYRHYDAEAVGRLGFIARAKALGLSLEEIKELLDICAGDGCAASQTRLQHVLAHKIGEVRTQIAELQQLKGQLEDAFQRITGGGVDPETGAPALNRELRIIDNADCTCGATCDEESCALECACCPMEEVTA